jgi:hypothetical protein
MNEFVDQLERELRAAAGRRVRLETARIPRPSAGAVVVLISLALCAAVVLGALRIHTRSAVDRPPSHPAHRSSPPAATRPVDRQIVASFSAFRRPRTAADAIPVGLRFSMCGGEGPGNYSWCDVDQGPVPSPPVGSLGGTPPSQYADAKDDWRLPIYGHVQYLQVNRSRRLTLPGGLGAIWLIPSGRYLCGLLDGPRWHRYPVRMTCAPIATILRRPPIRFPGFFGSTAHGIWIGAEPDRVARASISYPGGTEPAALHDGALTACVGQGPYALEQTTTRGPHVKPLAVGAVGPFRGVSCPELGVNIG